MKINYVSALDKRCNTIYNVSMLIIIILNKWRCGIIYNIRESLGFLLYKNHQRAFSLFSENLKPHGITSAQFTVLAFLWEQDGLSQMQLCNIIAMDRTTLSGVIDRLKKQELVVRQDDPADRRSYLIYLTPKGKSLQALLSQDMDKANAVLSANLSEVEKTQLINLLKKCMIKDVIKMGSPL